ncbi:MAG: DNA-binding protein WhiA [Nitriliruptoraceae bacterium]
MASSFTEIVRQELAHSELPDRNLQPDEIEGILRFAGVLTRHGGTPPTTSLQVITTSGAVARRTFRLVHARFDYRSELFVQKPSGLTRATRYGVRFNEASAPIARAVGLFGKDDRVQPPQQLIKPGERAISFLRGVVLAAATFSAPHREAHCEIAASNHENAVYVQKLFRRLLGSHVHISDSQRLRIIIKSGKTIGELLSLLGATNAFMQYDEQRLRRQLRSDANRLANADNANLKRSVAASLEQTTVIRELVNQQGLEMIPGPLRQTALVRLANPHVSLRELGLLLDPPVGKAAVHRRLAQLAQLRRDASKERPIS